MTGEEVTYAYDSLSRMISASTTGPEWGQSYGYDGFGNRTTVTVTKGTAPSGNLSIDPMTNRITNPGFSYDGNGNLTAMPLMSMSYDVANRVLSVSGDTTYGYDAENRRVWKAGPREVYYYGVDGRRLGAYRMNWGAYPPATGEILYQNVYFAGRLIKAQGKWVATDRLGSVVKIESERLRYFPWGEEQATTTQNREKFGTYFRDSTGLDYADQRYYSNSHGRFLTPDPSAPGDPAAPQSWNYYAYVQGDPIKLNDPDGLEACRDVLEMRDGMPTGRTIADLLNTNTDLGLLATTIFVESVMSDTPLGSAEMGAIGAVIINRYNIVNGYIQMAREDGTVQQPPNAWGVPNRTLRSIVVNPTQFQVWQGPGGTLTAAAQGRLDAGLASHPDSKQCKALLNAIGTANADLRFLNTRTRLVNDETGLMYTGFNSFTYEEKCDWEQRIGQYGSTNTFYGVPAYIPVSRISVRAGQDDRRIPRPRPRLPGGGR